jgi:long-subunit acyl-CoA synthetase (AMP-forming)
MELVVIFVGMPCCCGRIKTLTDASVRNCKGVNSAFRPLNMVGVPAVWEGIRKGIVAKVNSENPITKAIFNGATYVHLSDTGKKSHRTLYTVTVTSAVVKNSWVSRLIAAPPLDALRSR